MAEIKSTLEMVLARAAKMAEAADSSFDDEDLQRTGMRLAAEYLSKKELDLSQELASHPAPQQVAVRIGMVKTLLRNVVLPREESQIDDGKFALQGILSLGGGSGDIQAVCGELDQILQQYGKHKEQVTKQLEDAISARLEQQAMMSGQTGGSKMNPAMHPQFREEMAKALTSLNQQYNDAMEQRKDMILASLSPHN